jgi:salicylate hydroxylase
MVIDAADHDQCYRSSLHNRPPIRDWSTQRATLLGDAAHPMLPYLTQGTATAIEDGAVLTRALAMSPIIAEALQLYQVTESIASRRSSLSRLKIDGCFTCAPSPR